MKLLLVLVSLLALPAIAQTVAPVEVPKHTCKRPGEAPGKLATNNQVKVYAGELKEFRLCLTAYAEAMRAEAQARMKAGNAAVEEYNALVVAAKAAEEKKD